MSTQDPFSRRKTNNYQQLGEVSSVPDTSDLEREKIAPFVPSNADVDEGYTKMMAILKQQSIDDARDGLPKSKQPTQNTSPVVTTVQPQSAPSLPTGNYSPLPTPSFSSQQNTSPFAGPSISTSPTSPFASATPEVTTATTDQANTNKEENNVPVKPAIKDEDVLPILDSILLRGYASETFSIRGNKVTLRTQFYWEEYAVRAAVEEHLNDNSLRLTADTLLQKYILASCLESFGNNYFQPISQGSPIQLRESIEERVAFLDTLPTLLVYYLGDKRVEFNDKVLYLSENFDRLLKNF